jgi:plastocyanin
MTKFTLIAFVLALGLNLVFADLYIHNPRGSNNRLNEKRATRKNGNRMFDSQNNARGGYNVGDVKASKSRKEDDQYRMKYFQSGVAGNSELVVQYTNQHGCGNEKLNCNVVIQYKCQDDVEDAAPRSPIVMRNGRNTGTPKYQKAPRTESESRTKNRMTSNTDSSRGVHESWHWYDACYQRKANGGLFTADQNLGTNNAGVNAAIHTRQNNAGTRRGYECPEERDYYPYFHPTPWTDIAVLADNNEMCNYYKKESFNGKAKGLCVEEYAAGRPKHYSQANNPEECEGEWTEFESMLELAPEFETEQKCKQANTAALRARGIVYKFGKPYDEAKIAANQPIVDTCFVQPPPVKCEVAQYDRVNHLGDGGRDGTPLNYTWVLPHFPSLKQKRCVLRMRYNISTTDYDQLKTFAESNDNDDVIENDPEVTFNDGQFKLQLAINTAQFGRTFQDRTHVFHIAPRPEGIKDAQRLLNLNVRGKRGNLVQTIPAVEYDFIPNDLSIKSDDLVHIQWTGSNTHDNNAPGGDGATGDAGQGKGGTDRSNLVQLESLSKNIPLSYDESTLYNSMTVAWNSAEYSKTEDVAIQLASSGYYKCADPEECGKKSQMQDELNNAPASYAGLVASFKKGTYYYMCTRNNNFTNRSQKGKIVVK